MTVLWVRLSHLNQCRYCLNSHTLLARLAAAWDPCQIVEITMVIGMTEYFNRCNNSLRVEPTK